MTSKLDLSDITLCAADSAMIPLTVRAMNISIERCKFGDAILFSHDAPEGAFRTVTVDKIDRSTYQTFRLKPTRIETPFTLWIEWDGYLIEPRAWHPGFREFDYIGAKLQNGTVGNSGFCLQSRKFNDALADERFVITTENVDVMVCEIYRPILEREFGIRFAPPHVADLFSYMPPTLPRQPTLGFHGLGGMWRHCSDDEIAMIVEQVPPYVLFSPQFVILLWTYAMQCKFAIVERLYAIMRKHGSQAEITVAIQRGITQPHADALFELCEQLVSQP
jgi:hypothetical protein